MECDIEMQYPAFLMADDKKAVKPLEE